MAFDWLEEAGRQRRRWDRDYRAYRKHKRLADLAADSLMEDWNEREAHDEQHEHVMVALRSDLVIADDVRIPRLMAEVELALQRYDALTAIEVRKQVGFRPDQQEE